MFYTMRSLRIVVKLHAAGSNKKKTIAFQCTCKDGIPLHHQDKKNI
jgi:hypothetical protein